MEKYFDLWKIVFYSIEILYYSFLESIRELTNLFLPIFSSDPRRQHLGFLPENRINFINFLLKQI
jgi:hypothetical protein